MIEQHIIDECDAKVQLHIAHLEQQLTALTRENELLRQYGNKDCTAMADEALKEQDNG